MLVMSACRRSLRIIVTHRLAPSPGAFIQFFCPGLPGHLQDLA